MVFIGQWGSRSLTISLKPNCVTVSFDDPAEATVLSYDLAGRLWTAYLDGVSYRRGLDGKMIAKWRAPGNERKRHWLASTEAAAVEQRAHDEMAGLVHALETDEFSINTPLPPDGMEVLCRAAAFDHTQSLADAEGFQQVYKPIGILPPDRYMSIVLQVTEGCSFNTCTFCTFYKDRPFRIKSPREFRAHSAAVRDYLGAGISLRRTIFLGDANALVIPMARLLPLIDVVHQEFDVSASGGIYAFLDGFSGEKKSSEDYAVLADQGLTRVYIGLESGHDALLSFLKKPGTAADSVAAVRAMKEGGIAVGVIILLGAGGRQFSQEHVTDTARVLNVMDLGADDIVYFSEMITSEGMPYAQDALNAGLVPLTHPECTAQQEAIEARLIFRKEQGLPRTSRYDIREFIY